MDAVVLVEIIGSAATGAGLMFSHFKTRKMKKVSVAHRDEVAPCYFCSRDADVYEHHRWVCSKHVGPPWSQAPNDGETAGRGQQSAGRGQPPAGRERQAQVIDVDDDDEFFDDGLEDEDLVDEWEDFEDDDDPLPPLPRSRPAPRQQGGARYPQQQHRSRVYPSQQRRPAPASRQAQRLGPPPPPVRRPARSVPQSRAAQQRSAQQQAMRWPRLTTCPDCEGAAQLVDPYPLYACGECGLSFTLVRNPRDPRGGYMVREVE